MLFSRRFLTCSISQIWNRPNPGCWIALGQYTQSSSEWTRIHGRVSPFSSSELRPSQTSSAGFLDHDFNSGSDISSETRLSFVANVTGTLFESHVVPLSVHLKLERSGLCSPLQLLFRDASPEEEEEDCAAFRRCLVVNEETYRSQCVFLCDDVPRIAQFEILTVEAFSAVVSEVFTTRFP